MFDIAGKNQREYFWTGKAVRINRRYGARVSRGHAQLYNKKQYTDFINDMATQIALQHQGPPIDGDVLVLLVHVLSGQHTRQPDVDAYNKQVLDALEKAGVYKNDSQVTAFISLKGGIDREANVDLFRIIVEEVIPSGISEPNSIILQ